MVRVVITGTPGTGKTLLARKTAQKFGLQWVNEKAFAEQHKIGCKERKTNERIVPLKPLTVALNRFLKQHENVVVEGHLVCECKLKPVDAIMVVRVAPDRLAFRLRERGYQEVKIQDNVLCEGIDYCLKHAKRNYPHQKIWEVPNNKELKQTIRSISKHIKKVGPKK